MEEKLAAYFSTLGEVERSSEILYVRKKRPGKRHVLLGGHFDTVYGERMFRVVREGKRLYGDGVADMKGGLLVLGEALKRFEASAWAHELGWEVRLNHDEEIGSPRSRKKLVEDLAPFVCGLWFEPALPDGALVSERKGSVNLKLTVKGKKAHIGRNPEEGQNAIHQLLHVLQAVLSIEGVHVGKIEGGEALNVIPDQATAYLNIRSSSAQTIEEVLKKLPGCEILSARPPKPLDPFTRRLLEWTTLPYRPSGGVTDGNLLAAAGLPTLDTLGVVGGHLHSDEEYMELTSLEARTDLTFRLLQSLAKGDV